jgi:hypothetical protein
MIDPLIEALAGAYDGQRHREFLCALWEQERWFDFTRQERAAELILNAFNRAGLKECEGVPYAADGRTRYQDWTTMLAWDCPSASVGIGGQTLADRRTAPTSVVMWSAPLSETTAPVVDGDTLAVADHGSVGRRFVLTAKPPQEMKRRLRGTGALAVISDYCGKCPRADENTTKWCNAWGDGRDGWYLNAGDSLLTGFCLSPASGRRLRDSLKTDPSLLLTAHCESRLYEATLRCPTAVLPGTDPAREVWLFGHAFEQGAHDNCSGVSVLVEAAALLNGLIAGRILPRPRCSIRVIATRECLGMAAFATVREDLRRRAMAGLNVDGAGAACEARRPFRIFYGPLSAPTIGWPLAVALGRRLAAQIEGYFVGCKYDVPTADHMIADPRCGIPALWLGMGSDCTGYHSDFDTPGVCADASLRGNALLVAAWAYVMASMDNGLAAAVLPDALRWIEADLVGGEGDARQLRLWAAGQVLRDLARWGVAPSLYESPAARYAAPGTAPLVGPDGTGVRFRRKVWGTCTLAGLPECRRDAFSRWSQWQAAALYWTDGQRFLDAVARLVRAELGKAPDREMSDFFQACVESGLAAGQGGGGSVPVS